MRRSYPRPTSSRPTTRPLPMVCALVLFFPCVSLFLSDTATARETKAESATSVTDRAQGESTETDESPEDKSPEAGADDDATDAFLDEILVTSRRREESLQHIPVTVTAFDKSALEQRSVIDLSEVASFTPNLQFNIGTFGSDSTEAAVFIRGVGQGDTAIFADPGVGIYLDGIYLARAQGAILDLLEVERVEVLRGPQGTLFGKNTTGGAISLVTERPGRELGGSAAITLGSYDRADGRLSVDVPFTDVFRGSFSAMATSRDGFTRSLVNGQELNDDDRTMLRSSLEWTPEHGLQGYLTAQYVEEDENGGSQLLLGIRPTPLLGFYNTILADQGFTPLTSNFVTDDFTETFSLARSRVDGEIAGLSLDLSWSDDDLLFRSLTGYREVEYRTSGDEDGTPVPLSQADRIHETQDQVSQEFQLQGTTERSDWVLGAIYFEENPEEDTDRLAFGNLFAALEMAPGPIYAPPGVPIFLCDPGPPPPGLPCFGGAGNPLNFAFSISLGRRLLLDLENESVAVFGESTFRLSDRSSLTLGGRWTEDDKSFSFRAIDAFGNVVDDLSNQDSWSDWSGRASFSFQARPEVQLYANLARGFKSGGFNGRPQGRGVLDPFDPETVLSLELGVKSDLLDRRLRLNGAVFASRYDDQHFSASLAGPGGQPVFVTQNAGDSEIEGLELEAELHPGGGWVIDGSLGLLETELVEIRADVPAGVAVGNELPYSPAWQSAVGIQRSFAAGEAGFVIARLDYSYRDDMFFDLANTESIEQEAYGLLSARIVYSPDSGRWELAVFGTNLTDEEYLVSGFTAGAFGVALGVPGRPAEAGATFTWRF